MKFLLAWFRRKPRRVAAEPVESEHVAYPWCGTCACYHHPDHWQCKKIGGVGVVPGVNNLEWTPRETEQPKEPS